MHVALDRMRIFAGLNATEIDTLSHTVTCGGEVTYDAYAYGEFIGHVRVIPENEPVTLVTEVNF